MKKLLLFSIIILGMGMQINAQHFYTEVGRECQWSLPFEVEDVLYHNYGHYQKMHVSKSFHHHQVLYKILLRNRDGFVSVQLNQYGRLINRKAWMHNPLMDHHCGQSCGYYGTYYHSNQFGRVSAQHRHQHHDRCGHYRYFDQGGFYYSSRKPDTRLYISYGHGRDRHYRRKGQQHPHNYPYEFKDRHRHDHGYAKDRSRGHAYGKDRKYNKSNGSDLNWGKYQDKNRYKNNTQYRKNTPPRKRQSNVTEYSYSRSW